MLHILKHSSSRTRRYVQQKALVSCNLNWKAVQVNAGRQVSANIGLTLNHTVKTGLEETAAEVNKNSSYHHTIPAFSVFTILISLIRFKPELWQKQVFTGRNPTTSWRITKGSNEMQYRLV